ncbi:MAG: UDP-galactopyranose mutase [Metamycoplasmataceae bacterium]
MGAGISGATLARVLAENNFEVEIHEKRSEVGGHIYDYQNENILIQKYGPHIFHTSKKNVIDFIDKFWELNEYKNVVKGYVKNNLIPIPFNFESIDICFQEEADEIKKILLEEYPNRPSVPILELENNKNPLIKKVSSFIYENIFQNYTTKMWGLKPNEIDRSVTARIPVILSYYNRYFTDTYEGVPKEGFTQSVKNILNHKNIKLITNSDANKFISFSSDKVIFNGQENVLVVYTGPIDVLFNNKYGILDYRSLKIEISKLDQENFQECAVINYPAHPTMTRITEFKNFYPEKPPLSYTFISKEFPGTYHPNDINFNEPYYPLATDEARKKYQKYLTDAQKYTNLFMLGRLAKFKYINMDQAIDEALEEAKRIKDLLK